MLYNIHEAKNQALAPALYMAELTKRTYTNPFNPLTYTPFGRMLAASSDLFEGLFRERPKPEWDIDTIFVDGKERTVCVDIVRRNPFCNLVHFKRNGCEGRNDPKILLVAPMSGHYATLLRGTVRALIQDHDVYVTDWKDASTVPVEEGRFGLDDYIDYLHEYMRFLAPNLNVMAVCQPAPLVLCAVSLLAQQKDLAEPRSMILMGGPIDTHAAPTIVTTSAENRSLSWFENNCTHSVPARFDGAKRKVYPGFLQLRAFMAMNPARHTSAHTKLYNHLIRGDDDCVDAHNKFYDEYMAVMDVTAEFYLETVEKIFKKREIPNGTMNWRGQTVNPQAIKKCALMTVEGEWDDISAPGQTSAAHDLCTNIPETKHLSLVQPSVGHYGIFNGRRWREIIKPAIAEFIRKQF